MHPVQMGKVVDLVAGLDHCQIVLNEVTVRDVNFFYYKNQLLFWKIDYLPVSSIPSPDRDLFNDVGVQPSIACGC